MGQRPDLYVGLVCAAGTDLTEVKNQFEAQISVLKYKKTDIKVSSMISEIVSAEPVHDEYDRMKQLMHHGDRIRKSSDDHDGVASLIVSGIRSVRGESDVPSSTLYLIDSLKNPAEVDVLDRIYGRNYYTVSVFVPKEERIENLKNKIAKSRNEPPSDKHEELAKKLVEEDEKGAEKGDQDVQNTFPMADFFINAKEDVKDQIERFVRLVFGEPYATPTPDEYFMFLAKGSALRSCDLSRQVGAVIADRNGWVVSTGCNEVPLPGGGIYDETMPSNEDNRDKVKQFDPNYIEIQRSLIEFVGVLRSAKIVQVEGEDSKIVDDLLHGQHRELMSNARVRNLIEFGRVVHAEMHAITQAAAAGRSVQGTTLYCTTFPCHGCARHIISAGIREVIYIEPYPKSLTLQLYDKEIMQTHLPMKDVAENKRQPVEFRAFYGISPRLYPRVFAYRKRKDKIGTLATWNPKVAIPVGAVYGVERPKSEIAAASRLSEIIEALAEKDGNGGQR